MQLVVIDADAQGDDQIAPTENRIVNVEVSQNSFIFTLKELADIRMQIADFFFELLQWHRLARIETRRPHEANPLGKFWVTVDIANLGRVRAIALHPSIPAEPIPHEFDDGIGRCHQQVVMVENLADAPFFGRRAFPELGVGETIQDREYGFALRVHQGEVGLYGLSHHKHQKISREFRQFTRII